MPLGSGNEKRSWVERCPKKQGDLVPITKLVLPGIFDGGDVKNVVFS